jgi:survival-of-motor-neuron-related-splicing factor 30
MIDESLAELKPKSQSQPVSRPTSKAASPPPAPPQQEKWSRENHPAFKKPPAPEPVEEEKKDETPVVYQVNDTVMAKWLSGDKGFYPARITAVTGSSTKPMYTVKFKSYDTIETLGARDIRPMGGQKRKADDAAPTTQQAPAPVATSGDGAVLAAPATVYPQTEKKEGEEKPVKKFKKIKANKELEAGKNKWQEFNAKAMGKGKHVKGAKKESMFRTPEGVGGRVGFVGSGQTMRKDPTRSRHVYQPNEDLD